MPKYIKDFLKSRGLDPDDFIGCEIPGCGYPADDIHHVKSSARGKRTHENNGSDLIAVCRSHHEEIHSKNTFKKRESLLAIVNEIINI